MSPIRRRKASRSGIAAALLAGAAIAATMRAQTIDEFPVPTAASRPQCIAAGSDGNLWFAETGASKIGRITPDGLISEFAVHSSGGGQILDLRCLAPGPDGNLWFTTSGSTGGRVGKITTSGVITLYPHVFPGQLYAITAGPDGAMWFTETTPSFDNSIGRITTDGDHTEYPLPNAGFLILASGITAGPDGAIWFAEAGAHEIGSITTDGATITEHPVPGFAPSGITNGPDGNLWFTEGGTAIGIGQITTGGDVTQFEVPSLPGNIVTGPDGALWLTEGNKIGRLTADGKHLTEIVVPTPGSLPDGITNGPDGNLWFTEQTGNKIGRVNLIPPASCGNGRAHARALEPPAVLTCVSQRP
jgi:virginiamycin B lyase